MLGGKSGGRDIGPVDRTVVHVYAYGVARYLVVFVPDDGQFVHVQQRVGRGELHRVAHPLGIDPEEPHAVIGLQQTGGVGQNEVRLEGIGMQVEGVAPRELEHPGRVGGKRIFGALVVEAVLPLHDDGADRIVEHHVAEDFAESRAAVVVDGIAREALPLRGDQRPLQQHGLVGLGIVPAGSRVDDVAVRHDGRGSHDVGYLGLGVVLEGIGVKGILLVDQLHVEVEDRLLRVGRVLPVDRRELVLRVDQLAPVEIVPDVGYHLVVEAIGKEGYVAVLHAHILTQAGYLLVAVVIEHVAIDKEGIALLHVHIAEGIERVVLFIKIGTVAIHVHAVFAKDHIAPQHPVVGTLLLVEGEFVAVEQIDLVGVVARRQRPLRRSRSGPHTNSKQA